MMTKSKETTEHVRLLAGPRPLLKLALKLTPRPIACIYAEAGRRVGADWAMGPAFNTGWEAGAREAAEREHRRGYDAGQYDGYLMGRVDGDRVGPAPELHHAMAGQGCRRGHFNGRPTISRWAMSVEPTTYGPFK